MFAVGEHAVLRQGGASQTEEEGLCLAHLRGCFSSRELERVLLNSLPELDVMPPPMLPPRWEQRLDEKNGRIYFIDHAACVTSWTDPREKAASQAGRRSSAVDDDDADDLSHDAEEASGAADDLASLCIGVAPGGEEGFGRWVRSVERSALASVKRALGAQRDPVEELQYLRYRLLQKIHHAVVRRLLAPQPEPIVAEQLWAFRSQAVARCSSVTASPLTRDDIALISKHSRNGLTKTYQPRLFAAAKLNLRKVRKILAAALPPLDQPLAAAPPALPNELHAQLAGILLEPPSAGKGDAGEGSAGVWALAAESVLLLGMVSGSLLTLLQLPRAVYARKTGFATLPLALPLHQLQRRCVPPRGQEWECSVWQGFEHWIQQAGFTLWPSAPAETDTVSAEEVALNVLVGASTLASLVWERLGQREHVLMPLLPHGTMGLSAAGQAARGLVEMSVRASHAAEGAALDAASLTPQQATEMWQPIAVELRKETLRTLVALLFNLLGAPTGRARDLVATLCTLRILTVHLLLFHRCGIDAAAALFAGADVAGEPQVRLRLLDHLFALLLEPPADDSSELRESIQAEVICLLTAGIRAFFPRQSTQFALLHACVRKERALRDAGRPSAALAGLVGALCAHVGAQSFVSRLVVPTEDAPSPDVVCWLLPARLEAQPEPFVEIQASLRRWLVAEVVREAEHALASADVLGAYSEERSPCMRLLASLVQELVARASLCNHHRDVPNMALVQIAEDLLRSANTLLSDQLEAAATESQLAQHQAQLAPTFVGSLVPWLVDSLALFSAFAFEYAQRLLPLVLPLLNTLKGVLAADAAPALRSSGMRHEPVLAQHTNLQSVHPYKPGIDDSSRRSRPARAVAPSTHVEQGSWPGATQLQLRFDSQCCTEEGDWLTLSFYREGKLLQGRTLRLGGPWSNWPKQAISVPADSVRAKFVHAPFSSQPHERWGYSIAVTASRRDKTTEFTTPVLEQLRASLSYLGAKCASLLVAAEPVVDEEKENAHWLQSPLFARGLPLQLPATHSLMHPFFGIKPMQSDQAQNSSAIRFLDDLAGLGGGRATALHRHMLSTTPELQHHEHEDGHAARAERALLASLLSHHGLLQTAQSAATQVFKGRGARGWFGSPPPSPPGSPRKSTEPALGGTPEPALASPPRAASPKTDPDTLAEEGSDATGMTQREIAELHQFLAADAAGGPAEEEYAVAAPVTEEVFGPPGMDRAEMTALQDFLDDLLKRSASDLAEAPAAVEVGRSPSPQAVHPAWSDDILLEPGIAAEPSPDVAGSGARNGLAGDLGATLGDDDNSVLSGEVSDADWARLRALWRSAKALFADLCESHARTLNEEQKEADQGEGLHGLMSFVLLVAKQSALSQDTAHGGSQLDGDLHDLSKSMGSDMRKLFSNLVRKDAMNDGANSQGRKLEQEISAWVASRVAPQQLVQSMKRQQCRAYR